MGGAVYAEAKTTAGFQVMHRRLPLLPLLLLFTCGAPLWAPTAHPQDFFLVTHLDSPQAARPVTVLQY